MTQLRWIGALILLLLGMGLAAYVLWPMVAKEKVKTKAAETATTVATVQTAVGTKTAANSEKARVKIQATTARTATASAKTDVLGADLNTVFVDGVCGSPIYATTASCGGPPDSSGNLQGRSAGRPVN